MHNGHIRVNQEKMSKSLGNFFLIRDVLQQFDPEVVRFFMLRAHYRSPINYSDSQLEEARTGLVRLYTAINTNEQHASKNLEPVAQWVKRFGDAMNDDFNTPEAIASLFDLASEINRASNANTKQELSQTLKHLAGMIGLLQRSPNEFLQSGTPHTGMSPAQIEEQIAARHAAKLNKNFKEADAIRERLLNDGVVLEDKPSGTVWRRA
jgi:cysteinyl-tRNA synthetase